MTTPAHFLGSYVVLSSTKKYWSRSKFTKKNSTRILAVGMLFSIAIDLDVLITGGIAGHHQLPTHYPFFWLAVAGFVYSLGWAIIRSSAKHEKRHRERGKILQDIAVITLIASWFHMALDLVGVTMGIHWFWPFSNHEFSITPLKTEGFASETERWDYIFNSPVTLIGDSLVMAIGSGKMLYDYRQKMR